MMKYKLVELKEDDPIFKGGFIISSPNVRNLKKVVKYENTEKEIKSKRNKKKGD